MFIYLFYIFLQSLSYFLSKRRQTKALHKLKGLQVPQAEAEAAVVPPNSKRDQMLVENILVVGTLLRSQL